MTKNIILFAICLFFGFSAVSMEPHQVNPEVHEFEKLPEKFKRAQFVPQPERENYVMVEPDFAKNLPPFPNFNSAIYLSTDNIPTHKKYISWGYTNNKLFSVYENLGKYIDQGYGVIGIPKDYLKKGLAPTIVVFHPRARKSAFYLFKLIESENFGAKKNHYQIGLLLGYYEPNVYAFCFGTALARKAFPSLTFIKDTEPIMKDYHHMLELGKKGLESLGDERNLVLSEWPIGK